MDSRILQILNDSSPPIPHSTSHVHRTWAHTFTSRPSLYAEPLTVSQLCMLIRLASAHGQHITVTGSSHSPSTLTCTSSWLLNLDHLSQIIRLSYNTDSVTVRVEAGIRLYQLNATLKSHGLTLPNLGSIDEQSLAGALATGTHGSSFYRPALGDFVRGLTVCLGNGQVVKCSAEEREDLFRAALVSLGAVGIIVEVELEVIKDIDLKWKEQLVPFEYLLENWDNGIWTDQMFARVWWLPYTRRAVLWTADEIDPAEAANESPGKVQSPPKSSWYGTSFGRWTYEALLWLGNLFPRLLPLIERAVFARQYGLRLFAATHGSGRMADVLLMDCLYKQFVNEWALPLSRGPAVLRALDAWIHTQARAKGVAVHAPIEVRVGCPAARRRDGGRGLGYLDFGPQRETGEGTLYVNATLYRAFGCDPPGREEYYRAFEKIVRAEGGRPHWAKNFSGGVGRADFEAWYGEDLERWRGVRREVDSKGVFLTGWHRQYLLEEGSVKT